MTRKELDKLLEQYKGHAYGYEHAISSEETLEHERGMEEVAEKIWANVKQDSDITVDIPMTSTFDELVTEHGKDVIKDWLKAMLG